MDTTIPEANWEGLKIQGSSSSELDNVDNDSLQKQERERYRQDTRQRKFLVRWVVALTSTWLILVITIIFLQGFRLVSLENSILIALLATTTLNVLGLAYIVLEGLFGKSKLIHN